MKFYNFASVMVIADPGRVVHLKRESGANPELCPQL